MYTWMNTSLEKAEYRDGCLAFRKKRWGRGEGQQNQKSSMKATNTVNIIPWESGAYMMHCKKLKKKGTEGLKMSSVQKGKIISVGHRGQGSQFVGDVRWPLCYGICQLLFLNWSYRILILLGYLSYLSSPHPPLPWPPHLKFSREGGARQSSSGATGYEDIFKYLSSRWHRNSLSRSWHRKYICGSCWQTREVIIENKIDHTIYTTTRLAVRTTWTVREAGCS